MNEVLFWIAIITSIITCFGIGSYFKRFTTLTPASSSMLGAALTPIYLALFPLGLATIYPGYPIKLCFLIIITVSTTISVLTKSSLKKSLINCCSLCKTQFLEVKQKKYCFYSALLALGMLVLFAQLYFFLQNILHNIIYAHDTDIYFSQALIFAKHRTLSSIPQYTGKVGTLLRGDPHTFFFESLICLGLTATNGAIGYPNDICAKFLVMLSALCLLVSIMALASSAKKRGAPSIALILTVLMPNYVVMINDFSRDSFRLLSIVILCSWLISLRKNVFKSGNMPVIFVGALAATCVWAHTLNALAVSILMLLFLPRLLHDLTKKQLATTFFVFATFGFLGIFPYLVNIVKYHHFLEGMYYTHFPKQLYHSYALKNLSTRGIVADNIKILNEHLIVISLPAVLSAIFYVVKHITLTTKEKHNNYFEFYTSLAFLLLVFLPELIPAHGIRPSMLQGLVLNERYSMQGFIISTIPVSYLILDILKIFNSNRLKLLTIIMLSFLSFMSMVIAIVFYRHNEKYYQGIFTNCLTQIKNDTSTLKKNQHWVSDRIYGNYRLAPSKQPIFLYSSTGSKLINAYSQDDVKQLISDWGVKKIYIYNYNYNYNKKINAEIPFMKYLETLKKQKSICPQFFIFTVN